MTNLSGFLPAELEGLPMASTETSLENVIMPWRLCTTDRDADTRPTVGPYDS